MQRGLWTLSLLQAGSRQRRSLTQMQSHLFFWKEDLKGRTQSPRDGGQSHGEQLLKIRTELRPRDWRQAPGWSSELLRTAGCAVLLALFEGDHHRGSPTSVRPSTTGVWGADNTPAQFTGTEMDSEGPHPPRLGLDDEVLHFKPEPHI